MIVCLVFLIVFDLIAGNQYIQKHRKCKRESEIPLSILLDKKKHSYVHYNVPMTLIVFKSK